jgi:hypothetical protein
MGEQIVTNWAFDDNLFEVSDVEDINLGAFVAAMERRTFACIRGLVTPQAMYDSYDCIVKNFDPRLDHAASGQSAEAVRSNFQKINLGGEWRGASNDDARFFRAVYNRNRLAGLATDFAIDKVEPNGLWTAARFHQYPKGGGFFRRHTDYVVKDVADEKSTRFYQVVLTMSRKGEHFHQGGAFVDIGETRVCLDDNALMGDIIIYDGRTVHGVEDIDPKSMLDLSTINGRVAGFATLFKKM